MRLLDTMSQCVLRFPNHEIMLCSLQFAIPPSLQSHAPPSSSSHSSSDTHHHRRVVASPWPSSSAACRLHVGFLRGPKMVLTWSQHGFYLVPKWFLLGPTNGSYLVLALRSQKRFLLGSGMVLTGVDYLFLVLTWFWNGSYWFWLFPFWFLLGSGMVITGFDNLFSGSYLAP